LSIASPFALRSTATKTKLDRWHQDTALGAGLYTKDVELASTGVFNLAPGEALIDRAARRVGQGAEDGSFDHGNT
jgi:hypothetical protein